ncbi:sialidase family protein [Jiangella anatolica]|uniref:sialidase family protein n=1 Tax=Jiangella anatolica TaxID=2670374 RepID=UPI0011B85264|nr:sialidase family protein [Jiangella anatolica]
MRTKRRIRARSAFAGVALSLALTGAVAAPASAADGTSGSRVVYTKPADVAGSRIPQIAHSGTNTVVVGWRNETVELGSPDGVELGDIMIARSTDGGVSFGPGVALAAKNATYTYGNFVLFTEPETQDIYAYIARFPADAPDARTPPEYIGFKSTDGGASWAANAVAMSYAGAVNVGGAIMRYGNEYLLPFFHGPTRVIGVLTSTDLSNWTLAGIAYDGVDGTTPYLSEPFITVSNADPTKLLMAIRSQTGNVAYTTVSYDGGGTWSAPAPDTNIVNTASKGYHVNDGNNQYVNLYNSSGRASILYQQKERDGAWVSGQPFADGTGIDTYAMMTEYLPGKFYATWDNASTNIMFAKFEADDTVQGQNTDWHNLRGWTVDPQGGSVTASDSELRLFQQGTPGARVHRSGAPAGKPFSVEFQARITNYVAGTPATAVSLGTKVTTGADRLMLAIQSDGVWAMTSASGTTWVEVWAGSTDSAAHVWHVDVDSARLATLKRDGVTLASWTLPANTAAPAFEHWTTSSATDASEAFIARSRLSGEQ